MKLNPEKCAFKVASGKFLGYLVTQWEIETNPNQISAITEMKSPTTVMEVQILNSRLATLNRFLSKLTNKCKPFFLTIKKNGADLCWNDQWEAAFQSLKAYLASPLLLSKPYFNETLFLCLTVSDTAVSTSLVQDDGGIQNLGHPKSSLLCQQGLNRSSNKVYKDWKASVHSLCLIS